jgi:hypothetical protein
MSGQQLKNEFGTIIRQCDFPDLPVKQVPFVVIEKKLKCYLKKIIRGVS